MINKKENVALSASTQPNRFELRNRTISVIYGDAGADGKPYLNYINPEHNLSLSFKGDQIRIIQNTDMGKVVSVSLHRTIDAGSTSFTILVPRIVLARGQTSASTKTVGITTIHRFSAAPMLMTGQIDLYTTIELSGTASIESHPS